MSVYAQNPIMPGFYPDPSICAVGEDYYLINSTFAYFPGLPILHSKDLAHWEQIGNAMHRNSQLPLKGAGHSEGLFAPTIRYHEGTFYVICTNVSGGGNYIVTAKNPEGPWSEPYYLKGAEGIDPSLFFDDDGTCYYIGTRPNRGGCKYNGDWYIWIQELNIQEMKLVGEARDVWNGAMKNIIWPEGPHLYKKDGYYYIMHAEGGTGPDHAVTICRSKEVFGPYENHFCNPILTHRHLGKDYPIKYVGHADIIETPKGEWFMVMLAVRPIEGYTTMGRETFLAKVEWENGWPVVNPGIGMLTPQVEINLPEWNPLEDPTSYTFRTGRKTAVPGSSRQYLFGEMKELGDEFLFLRNSKEDMYRLELGKGLYLKCQKETLKELESPSYLAIRQQHHNFEAEATLFVADLQKTDKGGMALVQNDKNQLRIEASKDGLFAILCENGIDRKLGQLNLDASKMTIYIKVQGLMAEVGVKQGTKKNVIADNISIKNLSTEVAGGFVGCTVGLYATGDGKESETEVCFEGLGYQHHE